MKTKKIISLLAGIALSISMLVGNSSFQTVAKATQADTNLVKNGNFDTNLKGWGNYTTDGGVGKVSQQDGALNAEVDNCGNVSYSLQVYYDGFKMLKNGKYHLEFDISSTTDRKVEYTIQRNKGDYRSYTYGKIDTTSKVQKVSDDFTMTEDNDKAPRLAFNFGNVGGGDLPEHSIKIDNVKLVLLDDTGVTYDEDDAPKVEQKIVLNQLGYKPEDKKKIVFRAASEDRKFRVVSTSTKEVVYEGYINGSINNEAAGETDRFGDFSSVKTPGTYTIETDGLGSSYKFTIGQDVYKNVFKDAVRFFYMQRCGQEIPESLGGKWAHPACHTDLARIYGTDQKIDVSGGWHDAGDYGRYVVATSTAAADLLTAYNDNKAAFGDDFNIPESGNGIPDVLDEIKYQLQWLLKMQDQTSGGVYHKVTCAGFPGHVMPQDETAELIVCPISTTATGDFAAVMAMGYENFKDIDPSLAEKCLAAGEKAWAYLKDKPNTPVSNPTGIVTGAYEDNDDTDERYWAAAQLFKATGDSKYDDAFKALENKKISSGLGWQSVGDFGNLAYISAKGADQNVAGNIRNYIINEAQHIVCLDKNDGYNIPSGTKGYYWGSNMNVNNNAIFLAKAYKIFPNEEYLEYAKEHINYCFGKNSLGKCFVSGYGTDSMKHPHHRPSIVQEKAVPGMIAGGPNSGLEDPTAVAELDGLAPARCYIDNQESYSTNEVDIYWNSPFVCAMAEVDRD
ncbi:glycoside hydrolase family 9 protein [Clostridium sp. HBUAS56017]|uniref:glycoside hydrolase family 9 protein n=1 Tax=Clostridium sp. HBUAS56017 TaxID=2571128 RepID=UPI001177C5DA|nr:glycoside hydrolase family 9 protein [Clostridium sp. HBUAS56017]